MAIEVHTRAASTTGPSRRVLCFEPFCKVPCPSQTPYMTFVTRTMTRARAKARARARARARAEAEAEAGAGVEVEAGVDLKGHLQLPAHQHNLEWFYFQYPNGDSAPTSVNPSHDDTKDAQKRVHHTDLIFLGQGQVQALELAPAQVHTLTAMSTVQRRQRRRRRQRMKRRGAVTAGGLVSDISWARVHQEAPAWGRTLWTAL